MFINNPHGWVGSQDTGYCNNILQRTKDSACCDKTMYEVRAPTASWISRTISGWKYHHTRIQCGSPMMILIPRGDIKKNVLHWGKLNNAHKQKKKKRKKRKHKFPLTTDFFFINLQIASLALMPDLTNRYWELSSIWVSKAIKDSSTLSILMQKHCFNPCQAFNDCLC